ncbi:MAG: zinc-ribbon domain-containing protein [Clostridia bacterium]|nr:zinc-ribbon domain-containing protein [Clostridia bacterium]
MAFCSHCGAPLGDDQNFCATCGTSVNAPQPEQPAAPPVDPNTLNFDPADIAQAKPTAWLAYFGILFLVPLLACKNSPYARFHANQGLALFILDLAWTILCETVIEMLDITLLSTLAELVGLVFLALAIVGIVQVCQGRAKKLPIIGNWQLLK